MERQYHISVDPAISLVRLTIRGFMDLDTVRAFSDDRIAAMRELRCPRNQHVTLCDVSEQMISPPEVVEAFKGMIGDQRFSARRLAFVVDSTLARLQAQRTAQRDKVGYFTTVAAAEAWLFEKAAAGSTRADRHAG